MRERDSILEREERRGVARVERREKEREGGERIEEIKKKRD